MYALSYTKWPQLAVRYNQASEPAPVEFFMRSPAMVYWWQRCISSHTGLVQIVYKPLYARSAKSSKDSPQTPIPKAAFRHFEH